MKILVALGFAASLAWSSTALAQSPNEWVELAPPGESFQVSLPNQTRAETETVGVVTGTRYWTTTGVANFTVWSLTNPNYQPKIDKDEYLDRCAELIWLELLKPARDGLEEKERIQSRMTYTRELTEKDSALAANGGLAGREYSLTLGGRAGTAEFFVIREHLYVMLVMGDPTDSRRFFASFKASGALPMPDVSDADLAQVNQADAEQIFTGREVTQKPRISEKREPTYTDSARMFGVTGTIVLRAVFSKDGEVTNVHVIRKLPHGLTQAAIAAARGIRFTPAMKDGQPASMWMELQYNFNLY